MHAVSTRVAFAFFLVMLLLSGPVFAQSAGARRIADLEARILALEEQIRGLVGRVEDAEFRSRETSQRLERLLADVDARLQGIEPGPASAAETGGTGTTAAIAAQ